MAFSPIPSWHIDGEKVETVTDHEIERRLLLGRKGMTNLDSILRSWDITLLTKVHIVKAIVFTVVMYGCESRAIKKTEHRGTDAFKLVVLKETLESPLDSKEIKSVNPKVNQPWIFIGRTDAEAEAQICILATWWEKLTHWKKPWYWKRLKEGGEEGNRGWDGWMPSSTQWTWICANSWR